MAASISLCYQLHLLCCSSFNSLTNCFGESPAYPNSISLFQGKVNYIQQACALLPWTGNEQQCIIVILRDYLSYTIRFSFLSNIAHAYSLSLQVCWVLQLYCMYVHVQGNGVRLNWCFSCALWRESNIKSLKRNFPWHYTLVCFHTCKNN